MNWLIINLKDTPTGRKLKTWSWTNAVQIQKEKKRSKKRMSWSGKNETSRKSLVSWKLSIIERLVDRERRKLDTYSFKCINFGRSKTQAFFKNMEKFILSLDQNSPMSHGVVWISCSRLFFFVLTELAWCELPGSVVSGTALWSWWSSLFQKGEVVRRCCTWSWTCLAALDAFDVICVQKWTKLSQGAPVQLLSLILGLSSAWWRIGSRSLGTSGFVVSPCNLQVFRQHSTLYLCTSGVPTTRRQYGAELFTLGALFLAHMAMAGSASLNVEMILRVIPPLKWHDWLDRNGRLLRHFAQFELHQERKARTRWSSNWAKRRNYLPFLSNQACHCLINSPPDLRWNPMDDSSCCPIGFVGPGQVRLHIGLLHTALQMCNCKGHFDWNEVCLCTNCENQSPQ